MSLELKVHFTIWFILIPFAHLDPVNQLRYEETKARDTVSNLHSRFFRALRQWCIQVALENWICCLRCSPFLTFLKVALWLCCPRFLNTASLKLLHLRRHWSQKSLSWCTTSRYQIDMQGCWTSSSSYSDHQRTETLDTFGVSIPSWSYFALGTSWEYNHSFYQFTEAKVSRPGTRWLVTAQHPWGDGTTHTKRISHPCTRSWRVPRIQDWNNASMPSQSISDVTLLLESRNT